MKIAEVLSKQQWGEDDGEASEFPETEMFESAIALIKTVDIATGKERFIIANTRGMGGITQLGLMTMGRLLTEKLDADN